jgi:hypothetical protein
LGGVYVHDFCKRLFDREIYSMNSKSIKSITRQLVENELSKMGPGEYANCQQLAQRTGEDYKRVAKCIQNMTMEGKVFGRQITERRIAHGLRMEYCWTGKQTEYEQSQLSREFTYQVWQPANHVAMRPDALKFLEVPSRRAEEQRVAYRPPMMMGGKINGELAFIPPRLMGGRLF